MRNVQSKPLGLIKMQETNTALKVAIFICLGFVIFYNVNPIPTCKFRYKVHLMSQEEKLAMQEKILIDKIMRK